MPKQRTANLVWCLAIGWCFVAPKTAWGKARRGSIAAALCDRGATKPQAVFGATLRAAVLFASRFVARSSQTAEGMLVARASRETKIPCGETPANCETPHQAPSATPSGLTGLRADPH